MNSMRLARFVGVAGMLVLPQLLVSGTQPGDATARRVLTCASYNIREAMGRYAPYGSCKTNTIEQIARIIRTMDPDWIGLQETVTSAPDDAARDHAHLFPKLTGMHCTFAGAQPHGRGEWGNALLSKEKPLTVRVIKFDRVTSGPQRCALVAEFADYVVCCTHLALRENERCDEARRLLKELADVKKPLFLCGDLNSRPGSEPMRILGERFAILSDVTQHTFPLDKPHKFLDCVDYILVDKAHADAFPVLRTSVIKELEASDHYPISVICGLRQAQTSPACEFHYHSRHIPLEHLNLDTPMGRVVASNGLHTVLEPDNLAKLKSFGVDTVELRLTWCELEKAPGQFDFSRFDRDIERVEKAGLQPGLMAWFNHPPSWYGGTRFKCLSHGLESTTLSPWDPATLREADRLYAKVAERYGDRIKFVYVTGSGDYGEPCLPQGVRHYVFSSPHSHIGLDWVGDRFARAAWARVSSVSPEDVVRGACDRATAVAFADFVTERTAGYVAETFRLVRRHFPHARYGVPIGHVPDIAHGQSRSLVVKRMCEVSPDFTARWTGMAYLGEFGRCNALANRISSAARFYGCAFGEEAADYIGPDNAANAVYEAVANGCTMLHNDFGNIVRAAAVNVDLSHLPLVDPPVSDVALLWPDIDEKEFSVRHATATEAESATFTLKLADQAAAVRRQTNFEMCDSLMVRDGFLKRSGIRRLLVFGAPPPELKHEIGAFKAAGGVVETVPAVAPSGRTVYRTRHRNHESSYSPSDGRIEVRKR